MVDRLVVQFPDSLDALDAVAWAHQRFRKTPEGDRVLGAVSRVGPRFHVGPACARGGGSGIRGLGNGGRLFSGERLNWNPGHHGTRRLWASRC